MTLHSWLALEGGAGSATGKAFAAAILFNRADTRLQNFPAPASRPWSLPRDPFCFTPTQAQEAPSTPPLLSAKRELPNQPENMVWIPGGELWMGGPSKVQALQAADNVP